MKRMYLVSSLVVLFAVPALAQVPVPRVSPKASVSQTIGTTDITVEYHRPAVRDRQIWGGLVPYNQPWRMGANEATTITFSDPVRIQGNEVPAGKYSFFAIPAAGSWTLVLNKDPEQWGAYGYDQSKDQLRATVTPQSAPRTEFMRFTIDPVSPSSANVTLTWESMAVSLPVEVDVNALVWADIDEAMKNNQVSQAQLYASAAGFALESGDRLDQGLTWVNQSIAINENVFNLWTKAQILHKLGRAKEALPIMEKAVGMARGSMPQDFMNILEGTLSAIRKDVR